MRKFLILGACALVVGCGGRATTSDRYGGGTVTRIASGPISSACMASNRQARSQALCGCIQSVANRTLTGSEQRRAAGFYRDPQEAQDIRQSDNPSHERFWQRYKNYAQTAQGICG